VVTATTKNKPERDCPVLERMRRGGRKKVCFLLGNKTSFGWSKSVSLSLSLSFYLVVGHHFWCLPVSIIHVPHSAHPHSSALPTPRTIVAADSVVYSLSLGTMVYKTMVVSLWFEESLFFIDKCKSAGILSSGVALFSCLE
jgi:hypothetical protein